MFATDNSQNNRIKMVNPRVSPQQHMVGKYDGLIIHGFTDDESDDK